MKRLPLLARAVALDATALVVGQGAWLGAPDPARAATGDGEIDLAAIAHDSRDARYRGPSGAVPAGIPVTLRLRTAHDDVDGAAIRLDDGAGSSEEQAVALVHEDVPCGDPGSGASSCDFSETTVASDEPSALGYRFAVTDGEAEGHYTDDPTVGGGLGRATRFGAGPMTQPARVAEVRRVTPDAAPAGAPGRPAPRS